MQVGQYAPPVATTQEAELEQLSLLFAQQQLAIQKADAVLQEESEKTLVVFKGTIDAQATENRALQNENAVLRERLAAMESQKRKLEVLHANEKKAIEARSAEEINGLKETCSTSKMLLQDLVTCTRERDNAFNAFSIEFHLGIQGEATSKYPEVFQKFVRIIEKSEAFLKK